jgi:hypothetical protein
MEHVSTALDLEEGLAFLDGHVGHLGG